MKIIETTTTISASPDEIWETLVDFDAYTEWNPFVTAADPGERLEWLDHLGVRGLFDGRHEFRLSALDDARTELAHRETFGGLLVGLLLDEQRLESGFRAMNESLKQRVEATGTATPNYADASIAA